MTRESSPKTVSVRQMKNTVTDTKSLEEQVKIHGFATKNAKIHALDKAVFWESFKKC